MREYSTPPAHRKPGDLPGGGGHHSAHAVSTHDRLSGTVADDVVVNAGLAPDAIALARRAGDDAGWQDVTCADLLDEVTQAAKGLIAAGVEPGDRVVLLSRTRWEWTVLDYAIWFAGAVSVPLYATAGADQLHRIVADSGARVALVETPADFVRVSESAFESIWIIDPGAPDGPTGITQRPAMAVLAELGRDISDDQLEARRTGRGPGDLATLLYTSGTTGPPRGCMITHANLIAEVDATVAALRGPGMADLTNDDAEGLFKDGDCTLLFLPLAHILARVVQLGCVRTRTPMAHTPDVSDLAVDLREFRPTFVLAVPRVFETSFNRASQRAAADGRASVFDRATESAMAWSRDLDRGGPRLLSRARQAVYSRLVHARLQDAFGGRCRYAISGGAPLGERLGHVYRGVGMSIFEGYGLTETTAAVTLNLPGAHRIGTVGRPLPGTAVRVADDGELLIRGPQVFGGYWDDPEGTAAVLSEDGWLHTGDVGEVDDEGFVRVTGRKREILVTAGGKVVAPAVLEDRMRAHPLVSQALVVGDGRPFVGALVTLDETAVAGWLARRGLSGTAAEHCGDPSLLAEIQSAVDTANSGVSRAESIRRFQVLPQDWSEEAGQLTPSLKLRRAVVVRESRAEIAALYRP